MYLQNFPNLIWWTPAAFSGIFARRSKTVTLGECKCSYLGTALPSFLAQNRKNKGCVQPHGTAALAEVWGALVISLRVSWLLRDTRSLPRAAATPTPMWAHQTPLLPYGLTFFLPHPNSIQAATPCSPRTKNPLTGSVGHGSAGANSAWVAGPCPPLPMEGPCTTTHHLLCTKNHPAAPAGNGRSR